MEFQSFNMNKNCSEKSKIVSYKWEMPNDNLCNSKRNLLDVPLHPNLTVSQKGSYAKSSTVVGLASFSLMAIDPSNGIFWEVFMKYIYPWFLDIANVFVAIKIAQAFYEENRGGRDSGSGMSSIVANGKWLLLFHLIPFFVGLVNELGIRMVNELGV